MERYGIKNYLDHWTSTDIAVLYAPISSSIRMKNQSLTCFRLMSPPIVLYGRASIQFVWALVHMALRFKREQDQIGSISRQTLVTLALMNPKHSMEPSEQFYTNNSEVMASINNFKELGQCGKSVYIAKSSEIAATLDFLDKKFYGVKFNVGSDVLMDELYGWVFDDQGYSKIPTYLKYLLEGGILGRMMAEEQRRTFVAVSTLLPPKFRDRVNKMGSIVTFYILLSIIVLSALVCFLVENRNRIKTNIISLMRWVMGLLGNVHMRLKIRFLFWYEINH